MNAVVRRPQGAGLFQTLSSRQKHASATPRGQCGAGFTLMPPNVVGKKKPPGYVSDEPASPEVTCMGRVRRNRRCRAWDALVAASASCNNFQCSSTSSLHLQHTNIGNASSNKLRSRGSKGSSSTPTISSAGLVVPRPLMPPDLLARWKSFVANLGIKEHMKMNMIHMPGLVDRLAKLYNAPASASAHSSPEDAMLADLVRRRLAHRRVITQNMALREAADDHLATIVATTTSTTACARDGGARISTKDGGGFKEEEPEKAEEEEEDDEEEEDPQMEVARSSNGDDRAGPTIHPPPNPALANLSGSSRRCLVLNANRRKVFHSNDEAAADIGHGDEDHHRVGDLAHHHRVDDRDDLAHHRRPHRHDSLGGHSKGNGRHCGDGVDHDRDIDVDDDDDNIDNHGRENHDKNALASSARPHTANVLCTSSTDVSKKRTAVSKAGLKHLFRRKGSSTRLH